MRIVVTGATGNVGSAVLRVLGRDPAVSSIVGLARREPRAHFAKTTFVAADVTVSDLVPTFDGADAVVHLAWLIQPSRDERVTRAVNVDGSARVFAAAAAAGVPALIYASSVGAYARGPKDRAVDETWPTSGIASSFYSVQKAVVEAHLDRFEHDHPSMRVVRLRPGLIFQRDAASEIRRLFLGPLLPRGLVRTGLIPVVPQLARLRFQAVHAMDVAQAYRLAVTGDARGAFNIAADPVIDAGVLGELLHAGTLSVPASLLRLGADLTWRARLQPTSPGWVDMGLGVPIMDTSRAREELGWSERHSSTDALMELLSGIREGAGQDTPPLDRSAGGPLRVREFITGVGGRSR